METRTFKTTINAPAEKIWQVLTTKATYEAWTGIAWPGSTFEGEWKQGTTMKFMGPDGGGTLVEFLELIPAKLVKMAHIATLLPGGISDRDSDMAKSWAGTSENYYFTEDSGVTELTVEMTTTAEWIKMFEESWPQSLLTLKEMCES